MLGRRDGDLLVGDRGVAGCGLGVNGEDHRGHVPLAIVRRYLGHGRPTMPRGEICGSAFAKVVGQRGMTARGDLRVNVDIDRRHVRHVDHLRVSRESG